MATGGGYSDKSPADSHMSGPTTDQQNNDRYYPQSAPGIDLPAYERKSYYDIGQYHTQHYSNENHGASGQAWWEPAPPCPGGDRQPPTQLRDPFDYTMKDAAHVKEGKVEEVEAPEPQAHPGETGTAPPPDRVPINGSAEIGAAPPPDQNGDGVVLMDYESTEKARHGGHDNVGEPNSRAERGGPGSISGEPAICSTGKYVSHDAHVKKGFSISNVFSRKRDKEAPEDRPTLEQSQGEQNRRNEELKKKEEELKKREEELKKKEEERKKREEELKKKEEELKKMEGEWEGALTAKVQMKEMKIKHDNEVANLTSQVADLTSEVTVYKGSVERYREQLSAVEQSNSKSAVGTGAHPDSHATPPNLMHAAFEVNGAALTFTKAFCTLLKEQNTFETHPALQAVPEGEGERYRKYAMESYICSRLFAGFENDSYLDGLESYEQTPFFLQNQDPDLRHQRYVSEYEELQKTGLARVMDCLKTNETPTSGKYFLQFCCRKLVSIVDAWCEQLDLAPGAPNILHQIATNPKYSDKFLKPFVNLALVAFMLHHLAFQFHPPARIFRYARGTPFDERYMQSAVPLDDDEPVEGCVVGHMAFPGFQVGATIVKCIVYLVPSPPKPPACHPA